MDDPKHNQFVLFLRLSKPFFLLIGLVQFGLGVSIAKYLGYRVDWALFWIGLLWVFSAQLGTTYLHQYFDLYVDVDFESRTYFFGGSPVLGTQEGKLPRRAALVAAMGAFVFTAAFIVAISQQNPLRIFTIFLMILILLAGISYAVPPLQYSRSGYGELILALGFGFLIPAFSFELQAGTIHQLLTQATLPVVLLLIALLIALSFQSFSEDIKHRRGNLLSKIGLQNSVAIHQSSILLAYLILTAVMFIGLPRNVGLAASATIPLGLMQIWLVYRISTGAKPSWKPLMINGLAMVACFEILMIYSFWIG
ncbi:MAG: prenyltransferase [Chloroflexota bacterium]